MSNIFLSGLTSAFRLIKSKGIDVLNLYNRAQDDNKRDNSYHTITIEPTDVYSSIIAPMEAADGVPKMEKNYKYEFFKENNNGYIYKIRFTPTGS